MIYNLIFTSIFIFLVYLADKFGDSSKSTSWMFFLGPIGVFGLTIFWLIRIIQFIL
jgi:hypothetical protein